MCCCNGGVSVVMDMYCNQLVMLNPGNEVTPPLLGRNTPYEGCDERRYFVTKLSPGSHINLSFLVCKVCILEKACFGVRACKPFPTHS